MKTLYRILGTALAVAATGAAIVVLDKILNEKDPLHVENVEFPEEAEQDAEAAEKTAEAYAEGEAKAADAANEKAAEESAPEAPVEEVPAEPAAEEPAAPAENEPVTLPAQDGEKPVCDPDAPNPNPVEAGPAVAPKDENGKFDATKIAEAGDFGDWEEQGCKG